jgi:hypothetical protein
MRLGHWLLVTIPAQVDISGGKGIYRWLGGTPLGPAARPINDLTSCARRPQFWVAGDTLVRATICAESLSLADRHSGIVLTYPGHTHLDPCRIRMPRHTRLQGS